MTINPTDFLDRSHQQKIIHRALSATTLHPFYLKVDLRKGYLFEVHKERGPIRVTWGAPLDHPDLPRILKRCAKAIGDLHRSSDASRIRMKKGED